MTQPYYKYIGTSETEWKISPSEAGLGYFTKAEAQIHCDSMNKELELYGTDKCPFNKKYWTEKPLPWVVRENPNYDPTADVPSWKSREEEQENE